MVARRSVLQSRMARTRVFFFALFCRHKLETGPEGCPPRFSRLGVLSGPMLLNHFTSMDAIPGILIHGLLPREEDTAALEDVLTAEDMFRLPVVWLTREERPRGRMLPADRMEARITVNLPSNGKRLVSWPEQLQKLPKWREAERGAMFETGVDTLLWWMYFGTIPPERIVGVETFSGEPIGPIAVGEDVDRSAPHVIALMKTLQRLAIPLAS